MKIFILTSSEYGTAAHHLPYLLKCNSFQITMVILNEGITKNKIRLYRKKLLKILKIGILGALNGIRMRKWFEIKQKSLMNLCNEYGIPLYKTPSINSPITREIISQTECDLGISLGNGYIAKSIFELPKMGMINIHHEILPQYRNAQSIIWQIYNMSRTTGYTIHKINKDIDAGEILHQKVVPIIFKETLEETVQATSVELLRSSAKGLVFVLENFNHLSSLSSPQLFGASYTTPSIWQFFKIYRNFIRLKKENR